MSTHELDSRLPLLSRFRFFPESASGVSGNSRMALVSISTLIGAGLGTSLLLCFFGLTACVVSVGVSMTCLGEVADVTEGVCTVF